MYADDHQIYMIGDSIKKAAQELKCETEKVTQWYNVNLLKAPANIKLSPSIRSPLNMSLQMNYRFKLKIKS